MSPSRGGDTDPSYVHGGDNKMLGSRSSRSAGIAFVLIGALFASTSVAAMFRARDTQREVRSLVANTLQRVELVARMNRDLDEERLLIDAHTFEKQAVDMTAVERQIAITKADFEAAAREYDHLIGRDPNGALSWQLIRSRLEAIQPGIAEALALSRANRDEEARAAMVRLSDSFAVLESTLAELTRVSDIEGREAQSRMDEMQRSASRLSELLASGGIIATVVVGLWTTRAIREREDETEINTRRLEERNRELDAFAGRVAHDLRGPLTTISLAASRLAQRAPVEVGTSTILHKGISRMETMIEDLLTLSRVAGEMRGGVCDPSRVVAQIREELGQRSDRESVTLRVNVAPSRTRCNESLLRQAIWNLVDNGVKYRRPEVPAIIEIEGHVSGSMYVLSVSDNGLGMTQEDARQIFEPFFRSTQVKDLPGTGLGLSIVRRVVEAIGGTIDVQSVMGEGTMFRIQVPLANGASNNGPAG